MPIKNEIESGKIYSVLGNYIKSSYFNDDNIGLSVFPIIDEFFIKKFCSSLNIRLDAFIKLLHGKSIWSIRCDSYHSSEMIGFIGIQLYAASKMENANGFASSNFRDRICSKEILNIELNEWQQWATQCQDSIWRNYYAWCYKNGFIIENKCHPSTGKDRYVKYPKIHSSLILNREDLKRIAYKFVCKNLSPNEDLSQKDFWRVIGVYHYEDYYTSRTSRIIFEDREIANKQIYQYFLLWDGEFTYPNTCPGNITPSKFQLYLYRRDQKWSLDIIDKYTNEIERNIPLNELRDIYLKSYFNYKYDRNIIIFKKSGDSENYWEESRYIENNDECGLALIEKSYMYKHYNIKDIIKNFPYYVLIRINNENYPQFYAEERPYSISGGLKIEPMTYILGAAPILYAKGNIEFWVDGKHNTMNNGNYILNLSEGLHKLTIRGFKPIIIKIVQPNILIEKWDKLPKWNVNKKDKIWKSIDDKGKIIGLDFHKYSSENYISQNEEQILTQWCKSSLFKITTKNKNIVLSLINK